MKHHHSHTHQEGKFLTETMSSYSSIPIAKHDSVKIPELSQKIRLFVNGIGDGGVGFIALAGMPGVGKSSHTHLLQGATEHALGFHDKHDLIIYKGQNHEIIEVGGHVCKKRDNFLVTLHADHFFRAIGVDRRELMLQDIETCRRLWSNPRACIRFLRDIFAGQSTDVKIYLGTEEEKKQKKSAGLIELKTPHVTNTGKRIIIAEGVNVGEWATILRENTSIHVLQILFNLSPETSLLRVLRRDHERKGYSFYDILRHRLKEYFFILKLYMEPALQDKHTILFNKRREIPPFTKDELSDISKSLRRIQSEFANDSSLTEEHRLFILSLIDNVSKITSSLKGLSGDDMEIWKLKKTLKKEELESVLLEDALKKSQSQIQAIRARIQELEKRLT